MLQRNPLQREPRWRAHDEDTGMEIVANKHVHALIIIELILMNIDLQLSNPILQLYNPLHNPQVEIILGMLGHVAVNGDRT